MTRRSAPRRHSHAARGNEGNGEILLYQTEDGETRIEVELRDETVWLSLMQMADLFQRDKSVISKHIRNVFEEGELPRHATVAKFATVHREILDHTGSVSHAQAMKKAHAEYDAYRQVRLNQESPVEKHFIEAVNSTKSIGKNARQKKT